MDQYVLLAILLLILLVSRMAIRKFGIANKVKISPQEAKSRMDNEQGIILLDVRSKGEYVEKHIPKSTLIPVDVLANEAIKKIPDKNTQIIVYCSYGNRSARAVKTLFKLGYTNIYNLGGLINWPYKTVSGK